MAQVQLTDRYCAAAKAAPGERLEVWDRKERGLVLRVSDTGARTWFVRYRTLDGRQPRFKLGRYPKIGLTKARSDAGDIKRRAEAGEDPAGEQKRARAAVKAQPVRTFGDLAGAYLAACEAGHWTPKGKVKRARSLEDERGVLRRHVRPALGGLLVEEVTRREVRAFLRTMTGAGITAQTNRAHAFIRQAFAYAIDAERVTVNPAAGFSPLPIKPRVRVLTDAELAALWPALVAPSTVGVQASRAMGIALQLAALLLQRRTEVAGMAVPELDLDRGLWLIPAERMKGGRPHLVPLPPRSVELVREALALRSDAGSPFVFPSSRDPAKPLRGDSVTHAMADLTRAVGIKGATVHDLRRTGSTALTSERLGVPPFIRSKVLGHSSDAGGGAAVSSIHYDANPYVSEKRAALVGWERLLLEIVGERERSSNVTPLRAGGAA